MSTIVCASGVELLMEYLEGHLPADQRAAIEAHVTGCERCTAFVASYQQTPQIMRAATAVEMPEDLQASLLAALRTKRRNPSDPDAR